MTSDTLEKLCINTIRFLSVDAVQKAVSGHPGAPLGAAAIAYTLWRKHLKHNPANPNWANRDRFILSAGHASALLYSLLYLTGYDLPLEELKNFRQWGSKTAGHPEYGLTPGVEVTSGPLGQGFANGVGMAIAEQMLASHYNQQSDFEIIDHHTYALVSDGDLMEGISSEAASLAGHLKLGKLIYLYDDNDISIEGSTDLTFTEDVAGRFRAHGWQVIDGIDGQDVKAVDNAINEAKQDSQRPSLIICKTTIGYGSPNKAGKASSHGEPLGEEEVALTKKALGWDCKEPFTVPQQVLSEMRKALDTGAKWENNWQEKLDNYKKVHPEQGARLEGELNGMLPKGWNKGLSTLFNDSDKPMATRQASGKVLNLLAKRIHSLAGGSADLSPSNKSYMDERGEFSAENRNGHNFHFGVREHAMGSICNGLALHGGVIPYAATFFIFYDYMRPAVRLAALMGLRVIYLFTHDSVGLGEDGPTHQPIEQMAGLRSVPNLLAIRPADATETAIAWQVALENSKGPTALVLTRQSLPALKHDSDISQAHGLKQGGYTLWQADTKPKLILLASGSEVHIALGAAEKLKEQDISSRVVSLPCWELFDAQTEDYRNSILPPAIKARLAVEAASPLGWEKYSGDGGKIIALNHFGASAPGPVLYKEFGLTVENIVKEALQLLVKEG
jgi:transketolase